MDHNVTQTKLTDDYSISRIIKGGWQLAGGHGAVNKETSINDMFAFVDKGITTFDCADIYTGVEELIGEFLKRYKRKYGDAASKDIRIHTKFVPDLENLNSINRSDVEAVIDRSMKRLGLERLDLVQFHWWDYDVPRYVEIAHVLKDLQSKGKILHLAGTNFDMVRLKEITEAGIKFISLQTQYSILDHRPEHGISEYCQRNNIKLICYGTVAGGLLSTKYLGASELKPPFENRSLIKYKLIIDDAGGWDYFQNLLNVLNAIANKHNVSITNAATKYILDKPNVAGIVIGARNANNLEDTMRTFTFEFDKEDRETINKILSQANGPVGDTYALERLKGGTHAMIMKYNLNKVSS